MQEFIVNLAIAFVIHFFPVDAAKEPPKQWQYTPSLEVPPGPIPRDRCIRAVYLSQELKDSRKANTGEWWEPPIDDQLATWLEWHRAYGDLTLTFCDHGGDA